MALLTWSEDFGVGVDRFDQQHRKLVDLVNELHAAMLTGKGNEALGGIFDALASYTVTHFAEEEQLMLHHAYPALLLHRLEHRKLVGQVTSLQARFRRGSAMLTVEVLAFLKDWLLTHIQGHDRAYGTFFRERGVT